MTMYLLAQLAADESAFMHFVKHDTFYAVVLFTMTLSAGVLVSWRLWLNYNARTDMNIFLPRFQEVLAREGVEGALRFCKSAPPSEVIPRKLYVAGLENAKAGITAMKRAMAHTVDLEILPDLNFLLAPILAIAKIATMVGLLFTIISMIGTFSELGRQGQGGQAQASAQIGLALFATMLGLTTAIPLVFFYTMDKAWIHKFEVKMKNATQKLILLVQAAKAGTLTVGPAAEAQPGGRGARPMPVGR
jgi:biopolymer transport protein ExbB